jgi:hypothetical protein
MSRYRKHVIAKLSMPYPLGSCTIDGTECLLTATEDHGPVLLSRPPYREAAQIAPGPGGCMALVCPAGKETGVYAIMGCFVGYKFQEGAVYRLAPGEGGSEWTTTRILDLPFAHRIAFVEKGGTRCLLAASIARDKSDAADWSQAGTVSVAPVPKETGGSWSLRPVLEGIHRNHGLLVGPLHGVPAVLISGAEGIQAAPLTGATWSWEKVFDREASELALFDIDADGTDELITIEPFHGSSLRVYRPAASDWTLAWEGKIDFGHSLVARHVNGVPSILVSNRAGSRDLLLLQWGKRVRSGSAPLEDPERTVLEEGAGAANVLVLRRQGRDLVFSTNQVRSEVVVYEPAP